MKKLVAVLDVRNAAAQMKAAEALAVLASRTTENRKAITAANAIPSLVKLLGDGRRTRTGTPQERAAAVLADLARPERIRSRSLMREGSATGGHVDVGIIGSRNIRGRSCLAPRFP